MKALKLMLRIVNTMPDGFVRLVGKLTSKYLLYKYADIELHGKEVLVERENKPTIYIANHLSNVDGVVLNSLLKKNSISFMAGVKLGSNPLTSFFLKTIDHIAITPGSPDKTAIKAALQHLKSGGSIFIFPEGTRSRTGSLINVKKGFILLVKLAGVPVVPIALEGTEAVLPIDDKDMGDEKLHKAKVKVTVGEPFELPPKADCPEDTDWEEMCAGFAMKRIAAMLQPKYQGVYSIGSMEKKHE